ncbi:hypothetical protein WOB59_04725 [Methylocystis sp. IM4]|uniref:head-tail connector protein n=1 Tax=Methylocystis sp. IM4 TaxID=3136560 RepID=UPI00311945A5
MRPVLIGAPATEPVSLTEMKAWLREDGSEEDQLIQALVVSARMTLEAYTRRFFVTQSWRVMLDTWPRGSLLRLPFSPFQAVSAIRVYDPGGSRPDAVARLLPRSTGQRRRMSRIHIGASPTLSNR